MVTKEIFIEEYIKAIRSGNAAIFAGAGLSRPSGFVVWKDLLRPLAESIGIDIDKEDDLVAVAQYVRNESGNRSSINVSILEAFSRNVELNKNVSIVTRLPIDTYWTTNYDHLIEEGLCNAYRNADVKIESSQLSLTKKDRDAVVYKMHGDADHPAYAVLTKDDYIEYDKNYPFFKNILQADLISKTFLFIGFSFDDPNLDHILSHIRTLLKENVRTHYCFMKKVNRKDTNDDKEYGYLQAKQNLKVNDLKRYGIQTILLDGFSEITEILEKIEKAVRMNNVFISGSIENSESAIYSNDLPYQLGNKLICEDFKVTSGFGNGVGSAIINGALDEIYKSKSKNVSKYLCLRPFPQDIVDINKRKELWSKYREDILKENGIVVFMYGSKYDYNQSVVCADGCLEEFELAKQYKCIIIPIGSTGGAAYQIFDEMKKNKDNYHYLDNYWDILEKEKDVEKIVDIVLKIAKSQRII